MKMTLMPPPPDHCQECAYPHDPSEPHNPYTLFYKIRFFQAHGREPTYLDAMAHCDAETQAAWQRELIALGVDVRQVQA